MPTSTPTPDDPREGHKAATYTVAQLAELLDCSERHVHRQRDKKAIPGEMRIGRCVRFSREVIDRWIVSGRATLIY